MTEAAETTTVDPPPVDLAGLPGEELEEWLTTMLLIREFEQACDPLAVRGKIPAGIHSSAAQEAVAVGALRALEPNDVVAGTHRTHHHALAKGLEPERVMAELFGRATGCCGGRGGTMHLADKERGYFGGNGIVGAGVGIATGAALAAKLRGGGQVALGFLGDGGVNVGRTWESVNLAVIWRLPLIVVCENNLYAVETRFDHVTGGGSIARRAEGFGVAATSVDGQDVGAVYRAVRDAAVRARSGDGPTFVEARTYRYEGHNTGQIVTYRTDEEVESWRRKDPILRFRRALRDGGALTDERFEELAAEARERVTRAIRFADESPWPDAVTAAANVFSPPVAERVQQ